MSLPTAASKGNATRATSDRDRKLFIATCEEELSDLFNETIRVYAAEVGGDGPWRFVRVDRPNARESAQSPSAVDARRIIELADDGAASMITIQVGKRTTLVGQLDQYRYWTKTRARLLASSLASESQDG